MSPVTGHDFALLLLLDDCECLLIFYFVFFIQPLFELKSTSIFMDDTIIFEIMVNTITAKQASEVLQ